jgi:hypothetical protein
MVMTQIRNKYYCLSPVVQPSLCISNDNGIRATIMFAIKEFIGVKYFVSATWYIVRVIIGKR